MVVWLMLVGFVVFGVLSTLAFKHQAERDSDLRRLAAANGFTFTETDHFSSARVPFQIFGLGDRSLVENVLLGQARDEAPVRVFDFTSWVETQTKSGVQRTDYRHMTCCLTETDHAFPHLVIQPETLATRLLEKVASSPPSSALSVWVAGSFNTPCARRTPTS